MNFNSNIFFGTFLKEERLANGLTQIEVAMRYHVPQSFVSKIETGERSLKFYELFHYCEALGIDCDTLFNDMRAYVTKSLQ